MGTFDRHKTLDELEGNVWGEPNYESHLVQECHRLRRVPLCEFSPGNLRIMIGQHIGEEYLIPIALELLRENPMIEGDYYPGDLLAAVLKANGAFWKNHPELRDEAHHIMERSSPLFRDFKKAEPLKEACEHFQKSI